MPAKSGVRTTSRRLWASSMQTRLATVQGVRCPRNPGTSSKRFRLRPTRPTAFGCAIPLAIHNWTAAFFSPWSEAVPPPETADDRPPSSRPRVPPYSANRSPQGFDALSGPVTTAFSQDPTSGHRFLFVNRHRDRIKIHRDHGAVQTFHGKSLDFGKNRIRMRRNGLIF
jgi:hypothetical protein